MSASTAYHLDLEEALLMADLGGEGVMGHVGAMDHLEAVMEGREEDQIKALEEADILMGEAVTTDGVEVEQWQLEWVLEWLQGR
jgi:hypothetical protein